MLITGASRGLGRGLAEYYLARGLRVFGCSRGVSDLAHAAYRHVCLDVCDEAAVKALCAEIRTTHGGLDVLINNAGVAVMNHLLTTPVATVRQVLETNAVGAFLCSREAGKLMQGKRRGRIVNISSVHVTWGTPGSGVYAASKAFLEQCGSVLAREMAALGITVNTLRLAFVEDTGMVQALSAEAIRKMRERLLCETPLRVRDVAHVIDFLIAPESWAITNQVIGVGGVT